jgi:hypothetical protein
MLCFWFGLQGGGGETIVRVEGGCENQDRENEKMGREEEEVVNGIKQITRKKREEKKNEKKR